MDNEFIAAKLLYSLARRRKWGESHTAYENLFKIFKSEALGKEGMRRSKECAEELMRKGFIIKKPTSYGLQVSLNPNVAQEIKRVIKEKLGMEL